MTVTVRPYKNDKERYEVDIRFPWPNGEDYRERVVSPVTSKSGSQRWGEQRERELLARGKPFDSVCDLNKAAVKKVAPRLSEFEELYIEQHCRADRLKPSTINNKQQAFKTYLIPLLKDARIDEITDASIQQLKTQLAAQKPKSVNNILNSLAVALKKAVEWKIIPSMSCTIRLLKVSPTDMKYYNFDEYNKILSAADQLSAAHMLLVLLAGDAGLRMGECIALRWGNVRWDEGVLDVVEAEWRGFLTLPKGGRSRKVPMTMRLMAALKAFRHLRGERVLYTADGEPLTSRVVQRWMTKVSKTSGVGKGGLHVLRHTFCSHLAMAGAPPIAIQQLAGHNDLKTTMKYMHLAPGVRDVAINLLDKLHATPGEAPEEWLKAIAQKT